MKKTFAILFAVIVCAFASVAVIKMNSNADFSVFDLNVEALARSEVGGSGSMCSQSGNEGDYYMKLCSKCRGFDYYAMDRVAFCN